MYSAVNVQLVIIKDFITPQRRHYTTL